MPSKRPRMKRASNTPLEEYDRRKFISLRASRRYTSLSKNKDFIKEKGCESLDDFFRRAIVNKEWQDLFKAPNPAVKAAMRQLNANLNDQEDIKVWVRGKWVPFNSEIINMFYNLQNVNDEGYKRLLERPNYVEIITRLTNGQAK